MRGGLAYAEGGEAEEENGRAGVGIIGALGALAALNPRTRRFAGKLLDKKTLPLRRALKRPSFATETLSTFPLSDDAQRARLAIARKRVGTDMAMMPFEEGQGAWFDQGELSTPLVFGQNLPRVPGKVADANQLIDYASAMGRQLDQQAVPISRHVQSLFNSPDGADALVAPGVGKGVLKQIAQELGDKAVVAHKPGGDALVHGFGDPTAREIEELLDHAKRRLPGVDFRYAHSSPNVDRILIGDPEYATMPYRTEPRPPIHTEIDKGALSDPAIVRELLRLLGPEKRSPG